AAAGGCAPAAAGARMGSTDRPVAGWSGAVGGALAHPANTASVITATAVRTTEPHGTGRPAAALGMRRRAFI
ncbi:MAG: hypothetical protein ACRDS9_13375, partial [Pseudonocardiaceae bacterium]